MAIPAPDANPPVATPFGPRRLLVTAGPTRESIDAVRYLSNRSSGRMGVAIANAAADAGWDVVLLLGPVDGCIVSAVRPGISIQRFESTADLEACLARSAGDRDVVVMAAAVSDYRPAAGCRSGKLERGDGLMLELVATPDLVAALATAAPDRLVVGFALEPADDLPARARAKLERKGLDAIVANPLETMDAETVSAIVLWRGGGVDAAPTSVSKEAFGRWLIHVIGARLTSPRDRIQR